MSETRVDEIIKKLALTERVEEKDIPEIDLYMDQVIQLFESKLGENKRFEDDKILTKTMINNYAKGKLLMDIKNKKYSKEHIILMCFIYNMKGILALGDIKLALEKIVLEYNKGEISSKEIRNLYDIYLKGQEKNLKDVKEEVNLDLKNLGEEFDSLKEEEKKLLLSSMLVDKANIYKKLAEKILDGE